jgi:hypothetical protein
MPELTIQNVLIFAVAVAFVAVFSWLDKKVGGLSFPFCFINRPSMRTRFYIQERKKRKQRKHQNRDTDTLS